MYLQHDAQGFSIDCPNCGCTIDIEEAMGRKMELEFRKEMAEMRKGMEQQLRKKEDALKAVQQAEHAVERAAEELRSLVEKDHD